MPLGEVPRILRSPSSRCGEVALVLVRPRSRAWSLWVLVLTFVALALALARTSGSVPLFILSVRASPRAGISPEAFAYIAPLSAISPLKTISWRPCIVGTIHLFAN